MRYRRIVRFVRATLREPPRRTVPVALTCGALEENADDNRVMASALAAQGYPVTLDEGRDLHNFTAWRDAWDPHLTRLLRRGVAMRREQVEIEAPSIGGAGTVIGYGHFGRPLLLFPAERGRAWDLEGVGMIDAVADLIEAGRVKLYCVDSYDGASWSNRAIALEDRARAHDAYEAWIVERVVPAIHADLAGAQEVMVAGCSMGAYHAANFALRRADLFPVALCMSGSYDPSHWHGWGERGDAAYFHNPMDYVAHFGGDHLDWLRSRVEPAARLRAGPVGGHDRRSGQHARVRRAAGAQGNPS